MAGKNCMHCGWEKDGQSQTFPTIRAIRLCSMCGLHAHNHLALRPLHASAEHRSRQPGGALYLLVEHRHGREAADAAAAAPVWTDAQVGRGERWDDGWAAEGRDPTRPFPSMRQQPPRMQLLPAACTQV